MKSCSVGLGDSAFPKQRGEVTRDVEYEPDEIGYDPRWRTAEAGDASGELTRISRSEDELRAEEKAQQSIGA
jgi:hypothetical protein